MKVTNDLQHMISSFADQISVFVYSVFVYSAYISYSGQAFNVVFLIFITF